MSLPRPEHPEPQWERKTWCNLNGEWQFSIDHGMSGLERGLPAAKELDQKIIVPFCPESDLSGIGNKDFMLQVWYKRKVNFDLSSLQGKRLILHFGAADYKTTVWINAHQAGTPHIGGQTPFSYDITGLIQDGENDITVCCFDDTRAVQPNGKQAQTYLSSVCRYTRTTGIWQTVWYEIVPENHIKAVRMDTDIENATLSVSATLSGRDDLSAEVYYEGKKVGEALKKNQSITAHMEIALSETHLWDVGQGKLYDIVFRFGQDEVKSYFGMRHVEMRDGKFYLNGKSVFQRLVLDQGFYHDGIWTAPKDQALLNDIEIAMAAGFNGARLHQKVFEPRFLYHADKMGYLVWRETANSGMDYSDMATFPEFISPWLNSMERDYNHPSVVIWCPINETWDFGPLKKRADPLFVRKAYEETKRLDPSRPCVDTSGLYHVITDIFDVHDYEQDHEVFKARYKEAADQGTLREKHSARQTWKGEPLMVSEFGGIGYQLAHNGFAEGRLTPWCHRNVWTPEEFYEAYKNWVDVMLDNPRICGFCYTQLTDIDQEQNGFFTYETRKPKVPLGPLKEINQRKAAVEE
ncbi:MAG: beta-galactosidase [Clostridiales bacterium]|nr:beta-galactosidase [Clostridiales bacterium]